MSINNRSGGITSASDYESLSHWWAYNYGNKGVSKISRSSYAASDSGYRMFAKYNTIYSYNLAIAEMYDGKTKSDSPVVLIVAGEYSSTTEKHIRAVEYATSHMDQIFVRNIRPKNGKDHRANMQGLQDRFLVIAGSLSRRRSSSTRESDQIKLVNILEAATVYANRFGLLRTPSYKYLMSLPDPKHDDFLPVVNEKIEKIDKALLAEKERKDKRNLAEKNRRAAEGEKSLKVWLGGGEKGASMGFLDTVYLRIKGKMVETSGGASIPVAIAVRALKKYEKGSLHGGDMIGPFLFYGVGDNLARIGCHIIKMETIIGLLSDIDVDSLPDEEEPSSDDLEREEARNEIGI